MFASFLKALASGLSLWESKEARKYVDRLEKIKREYYEEINKPDQERSDAVLDNLEFELRLLSDSFSTSVGESNAKNK